jgi:hypothetical protein
MKNKLFLLAVFLLAGTMLLGGCGNGTVEDLLPADEGNPEGVVLQFMAALKDLDLERAKSLTSGDYMGEFERDFNELAAVLEDDSPEGEMTRELFNTVMANIDLQVTGHTIVGDEAVVHTISTHPDEEQMGELLMERFFEAMFSDNVDLENMSDEEGMELLLEIFREVIGEVDRVTTEADVPMIREDGEWKINGEVISDFASELEF